MRNPGLHKPVTSESVECLDGHILGQRLLLNLLSPLLKELFVIVVVVFGHFLRQFRFSCRFWLLRDHHILVENCVLRKLRDVLWVAKLRGEMRVQDLNRILQDYEPERFVRNSNLHLVLHNNLRYVSHLYHVPLLRNTWLD